MKKAMISPEGLQLMGTVVFPRDSVYICLLLPESVIICDKCCRNVGNGQN